MDISDRPWKIHNGYFEKHILSANDCIIAEIDTSHSVNGGNLEHIIKCVNEHDSLVAEVSKLNRQKELFVEEIERLKQENEQISGWKKRAMKFLNELDETSEWSLSEMIWLKGH